VPTCFLWARGHERISSIPCSADMPDFFGPRQLVRQALSKPEVVVHGDGKAIRSYLHLGDMAILLMRLLTDEDLSKPLTVTVGTSEGITIRTLAQTVIQVVGTAGKVVVKGENDYSIGNPVRSVYVPSTKLAKIYVPSNWTSLSASLESMVAATENRFVKI
jgi:nucleoside-diphosphate-sugar epimerase